jgi:hypothetical protein
MVVVVVMVLVEHTHITHKLSQVSNLNFTEMGSNKLQPIKGYGAHNSSDLVLPENIGQRMDTFRGKCQRVLMQKK